MCGLAPCGEALQRIIVNLENFLELTHTLSMYVRRWRTLRVLHILKMGEVSVITRVKYLLPLKLSDFYLLPPPTTD